MNSETPPSSDPLFGNNPSDLMREAMDPATRVPTGDPYAWQPPTPEDLQARLGGAYLVQAFLARGGMGAVYRGIQASLERPVAIKILPPQLRDADPSFAQRFKQEAKAMAQLNHPSIVSVYEFGEMPDGTLYFIMEFVDGTDVAQMVTRQGRLSSAHAMAITAHVCDALQYAHEHGVVHRDIKPANIMVGNDGRVKVADFGLAKSSHVTHSSLTMTGHVMGTPHFVAPEALTLGSTVDHRADIYAVGVMLYQMLTGKLPKGIFKMPSLLVAGLDPRYDQIIANAMREDRSVRYQAILDMRRALDGILTKPVTKSQAAPQQPAAAAAPAQAAAPKPQPGQHYYRPPQAARPAPVIKEKAGAGTWLLAAAVVLSLGGIVWMKMGASSDPLLTATKENPFTNSLGMKFVPVPGTKVLMCQHETRRQDYEAYAKENPGTDNSWQDQKFNGWPAGFQDDHPVVGVSWNDAKAFCEWLSKKEGRTFRLPTDREWSQAAGIGQKETWNENEPPEIRNAKVKGYTWGSHFPLTTAEMDGNYGDITYKERQPRESFIAGYTDGFSSTAPVMQFKANGFGFHDIGGNAREWVEDWWDVAKTKRVLRGSAWHSCFANPMNTASRHPQPEGFRDVDTGFRCVIEAPAKFPDVEFPSPSALPQPVAETTAPASDSSKPSQMGPIGDLVFPIVQFENATISECVEYFQIKSRDLDPAKKGITFLVDEATRKSTASVGLDLKDIRVAELIECFARYARLEVSYVGEAIQLKTSPSVKPPFPIGTPTKKLQELGETIFPTISFDKATLEEACEFLHIKQKDFSGQHLNLIIDPDFTQRKHEITLDLTQIPLSDALAYITEMCDAEVTYLAAAIYIQPRSSSAVQSPLKIGTPTPKLQQVGQTIIPTIQFNNATLGEACEYVRIKGRLISGLPVNLIIDPELSRQEHGISFDVRQVSLSAALSYIAELSDAEVAYLRDAFYLQPRSTKPVQVDPYANQPWGEVGKVILPTLSFQNATVGEAVEYLRFKSRDLDPEKKGMVIILDDAASRAAGTITLDSKNITVANALAQIATVAGLEIYRLGEAARLRAPATANTTPAAAPKPKSPAPSVSAPPAPSKPEPEYRTFTNNKGQTLRAVLLTITGDNVTLKLDNGQQHTLKASTLSATDIDYLKTKGLVLASGDVPSTALTPAIPPELQSSDERGFISLLDSPQTQDWKQCGDGGMRIKDGVGTTWSPNIKGHYYGVAWYSGKKFTDFVLKGEYRGVNADFNSGIRLRFPRPGDRPKEISDQGYEVSILSPSAHAGEANMAVGAIAHIQAPTSTASLKGAGEWNAVEVTVVGQKYVVKVNGQLVNEFTGDRGRSGYIGIENHRTGPVEWRNLRIKEWSDSDLRPKPSQAVFAELRTFTDAKGKTIRASLIGLQGDEVTLRLENGQPHTFKATFLSATDIEYLKTKGLVLPKAPAVAAAAPAAPKPPAPVVEPPKPAAVPAPSAPTTYGGMEFSPNWLPQKLAARRELLESFDFYCKAVVGNAPKGQEPIPGTIVGAIRWRMPIDEAIRTLPKGFNKLAERPMVHSCLPNGSLINCGFQFRSFQDRGQSFYELFMLIDKQRRVVSVMFRDNGKDIQWFPKPDGIREPYYNMFSELTYNGSTTQEVPYQILGAGSGVTCIKTALRKKIIALPNIPNMPQMAMPAGRTLENVHWYIPAPFARSILDIVEVYRQAGVIK